MTTEQASRIACDLMAQHKLLSQGWRFRLNNNKRRLGVCRYKQRTIELSRVYLAVGTDAQIIDTIKHEIAHALVPAGSKHGSAWKSKAIEVGCRPTSCKRDVAMPPGKFSATCPGCGRVFRRHKRARNLSCRACGRERGRLVFSHHMPN